MGFSESQTNFLIFMGWKTLGWAAVFLSVLFILRFMKLWMLRSWMREVGRSEVTVEVERARLETVQQICAQMDRNRRDARNDRIRSNLSSGSRDLPPKYEDVVGSSSSSADEAKADVRDSNKEVKLVIEEDEDSEENPPDYESLFLEDALARSKLDH